MRKINLNLRGKLIIVVVGVVVIFSAMDIFRIYNQKKNLVEQMNRSGGERVTLIAESLTNLLVAYDYSNMESLAERFVKLEDVEQINILNRAGNVIISRNSLNFNSRTQGSVFVAPINFSGKTIGSVEMFVSLDRLNKAISDTYQTVAVALSFATLLFGLVIYATVSVFIVKPLSRLGKAADQLALGNYFADLPPVSGDEMGSLTSAFSSMRESRKLSEERLIAIFENSPDAFIQLDANGNIINWNDKAANIFGYSRNEAIGKNFSMLIPEKGADVTGRYRKYYQNSDNFNPIGAIREVVGQRKNGSHFPLELRTGEIHLEEGRAYIVSARDITESKENEAKLLHAMNAAEAANAAKSVFLSNISHEIRTPMNSIIGMANLALKTRLEPKQRDYLIKIDYSAQHLLGLINDILDFSKIEANKLELEVLDFEFDTVFENLSNQLEHSASIKGLRLVFDLDHRLNVPLRGDPMRLAQVLLNYTSNAIKFTDEGEITIRVIMLEQGADDFLIRFEVEDTGIGIGAAEIDKLFQAFHQADASTTRKYGGTGLGLAISKQLVELMGGTVGVESQRNQGSTFWFTVRLAKGDKLVTNTHPPPLNLELLKRASILLIEDNLFNQQVALEMLREVGANVSIGSNGQEAIDLLLKRRFDCVLMDVQMPVMDGLEATRQIRSNPALAGTHIIAMTANSSREDRARCLAAGMDSFISKPVLAEQLYTVIAQAIAAVVPPDYVAGMVAGSSREQAAAHQMDNSSDMAESTRVESASSDHAAVIDLSVLAKMMGSDPAKIQKFALKFLHSAQLGVDEIETALRQQDMVGLAALGHRNKSPARTVGAQYFADLCQSLEQFKNSADIEQARNIVAQMRPLLERIARQIHQEMR